MSIDYRDQRGWNVSAGKYGHHTNIVMLCLVAILLLTLTGPLPATAKINVVATIKPVHSLVAGVMAGLGKPHLLIENGSPHTYALRPSNAQALQNADLVVWVGPTLETFLTGSLQSLAGKAHLLTLEKLDGLTKHTIRADEHEHQHDAYDPHIWLDPLNAIRFVKAIATALARIDPANSPQYKSNAERLTARLDRLIHDLDIELAAVKKQPFLTFHDAYQYFEKRFSLNNAGSIVLTPDRQPGARRLRDMRRKIKALGITCVFSEPQFRPKLIDLILEGSSARTTALDPIGAAIEKGPELYFSLLKNNARAFVLCLGGS